jgi:hypothetical protein
MQIYKRILLANALLITTSLALADGKISDDSEPSEEKVVVEKEVIELEIEIDIEDEDEEEPYWQAILMGGIGTLNADNATLEFAPSVTDTLKQTNGDEWNIWTGNFGVARVFALSDFELYTGEIQWIPTIAPQINVYYFQDTIEGHVDRSIGDNSKYSLGLHSTRVMFDLALTLASYRNISLYAIAGIGPSWNHLEYRSHEPDCDILLDDRTDHNFAYEMGGGITYDVTEHLGISVEYLYSGMSDIKLNQNGELEDSFDLDVDTQTFDLNSQTVFLGLRYSF